MSLAKVSYLLTHFILFHRKLQFFKIVSSSLCFFQFQLTFDSVFSECLWSLRCLIFYLSSVGNYVNVFYFCPCHILVTFLLCFWQPSFCFLVQIIQVGYFPHFHNYIYCIVLKMFDIFVCLWHKTLTNIALFLMTRSWLEQRQEKYYSWWQCQGIKWISIIFFNPNFLTFIVNLSDSAEGLSKFLTTNQCRKCAFVVPVYEVDRKSKFPETKKDLKDLIRLKKARTFHTTVFLQSQFATNASLWV